MLISELLDIDLSGTGVFNALIDKDNNFFINIIRLKKSSVPEFQNAFRRMNQFFTDIATLLDNAEKADKSDPFYRSARNKFEFHEVNGINLGFSETQWGAGWGPQISDQVLADAYKIVKKGSKQPEIFHLVALFEDNVAGDRLSDMIATIIEQDIKDYTLRMMSTLDINSENYPNLKFRSDGLLQNPYKGCPILLLPEEILHELPIAKGWDDIDSVEAKNRAIKAEMSAYVSAEWYKWASTEKKAYIREHVMMEPATCERVIEDYRNVDLDALNLRENANYLAELLFQKMKESVKFTREVKKPSSLEGALHVIATFKDWVENNRGWKEITDAPNRRKEKAIQNLIRLAGKDYMKLNDFDPSPESDSGRGPVDLKISRGNDKTVIEVKLSSNGQYLHGYTEQVKEYGKAEGTANQIYVLIDVGNSKRVEKLVALHQGNKARNISCPELIIVDAKPRNAASTYEGNTYDGLSINISELDFQLRDLPDMTITDLNWEIPEMKAELMEIPEIDLSMPDFNWDD